MVGSGPAGLMAAYVLATHGRSVTVFEKRAAAGRKLLVAGSSGLNVTADGPATELLRHYTVPQRMAAAFEALSPQDWLAFIESLGVRTFRGTSRRWFVEGLKAPPLLKAWLEALSRLGVTFLYRHEWIDFDDSEGALIFQAADARVRFACDAAVLALGGGSWEKPGRVTWPAAFMRRGLSCQPFESANAGFRVAWPSAFVAEAEGLPIKNVHMKSSRGERSGDLVVTAYGLEGTPVYFTGEVGTVELDLKPDLALPAVIDRLSGVRENLSPIRRIKKTMRLGAGALALLYHLGRLDALTDTAALARRIKAFPLELLSPQPLEEAISSRGGVDLAALDANLMLRAHPGVFLAGEMLDWDAPTGGYLIQACVSQGAQAARGVLAYLSRTH